MRLSWSVQGKRSGPPLRVQWWARTKEEPKEVLVLDALRYRPHRTHFSIDQAVVAASRIGATRSYLTHLTHEVDHGDLKTTLPPGVELAYDGLAIDLE